MAYFWPLLAHSPSDILNASLPTMLVGELGNWRDRTRPLAVSFVRVTMHSIAAYNRAKENEQSGELFRMIESNADLEDCIVSLHRALRFLDALKKRGLTTSTGSPISLRSKDLKVNTPGIRSRITKLRDAISHMDERVCAEEFFPGTPSCASVSDGSIKLDGVDVALADLVDWLNQVSGIAVQLAKTGAAGRANAV